MSENPPKVDVAPHWDEHRDPKACQHENVKVVFDKEDAETLTVPAIRKKYPRFHGLCPDCGVDLIKYESFAHFVYGDW